MPVERNMHTTIDEAFEAHVASRVDHAVQRALELAKQQGDETTQRILELVKVQREKTTPRTMKPVDVPGDEVEQSTLELVKARKEAMAQHALRHTQKLMSTILSGNDTAMKRPRL